MAVNASDVYVFFLVQYNIENIQGPCEFSDCMTVFECTSLRLLLSFSLVSILSTCLPEISKFFLFFHNFSAYVDLNM